MIHFFELSIVHNYFDNPNKTTFKSVAKFLDTLKPFFSCKERRKKSQKNIFFL